MILWRYFEFVGAMHVSEEGIEIISSGELQFCYRGFNSIILWRGRSVNRVEFCEAMCRKFYILTIVTNFYCYN